MEHGSSQGDATKQGGLQHLRGACGKSAAHLQRAASSLAQVRASRAGRPPTSRDIRQEEDVVGGTANTGSNPSVALAVNLGAYFGVKVAIKELKESEKPRPLLSTT